MNVKAGVARGAAWLGVSRVLMNLLSLVSTVVLARLLVPADFGIVAIATAALGMVMALTELSLTSVLIQREQVVRGHVDTAWTLAMVRGVLIVLAFLALAEPAAMLYHEPRLASVLVVTGVTGALTGLYNPQVALRTKHMQFGAQFVVQVTQRLAMLIVSVVVAILWQNYWAIVIGNAVGALAAAVLSYLIIPYRPRFTMAHARDFYGFSSWLFLGQVVTVLNWRFDQLLIGLMLSKRDLGAYSVADNLSALPTRETTAPLIQALFPGFANMTSDRARLSRAYMTAQSMIAIIAFPAGTGFALVAAPLVRLAMGPHWEIAVPIIQILSITFALQALTIGLRPLAMALGRTRILFFRDAMGLALRIPCVVIGMMVAGLEGLVWGRALSTVIGIALALELVRRLTGVRMTDQVIAHWRAFAATAAMGAAGLGIEALVRTDGGLWADFGQLALVVPGGALAYGATLYLLWRLSGSPAGAERELHGFAVKLGRATLTRAAAART